MNSLINWFGNKDHDNFLQGRHAAISTILIYGNETYDEVHILDNRYQEEWDDYKNWLTHLLTEKNKKIPEFKFHDVKIKNAIDFKSISETLNPILKKLSNAGHSISINFTSGTPAMSSISALLGYGIYNVQLIQTTQEKDVIYEHLPIDFKSIYYEQKDDELERLMGNDPKIENAFEKMVANSAAMKETLSLAKRIAPRNITCLILGETGTGKERMAEAICKASERPDKPVIVNCGALPESIINSTLFGHKKGSFTDARENKKGLFEAADGGTLFLDEIGELSLEVQTKLLRVIQEGKFQRVGDNEEKVVDVRIIAATHRDLAQMVEDGRFREDLFYRIAIGIIKIPALRERSEDILSIAKELLDEVNKENKNQPNYKSKVFYKDVTNFIKSYSWPGNVRELKNTITRAMIWSDDKYIKAEHLEKSLLKRGKKTSDGFTLPNIEEGFDARQFIDNIKYKLAEQALKKTADNKSKATKLLNLSSHQNLTNWLNLKRKQNLN